MAEAMLAGGIDISHSQDLTPFINAVNTNSPIKLVSVAVQYPANNCVIRKGEGIDNSYLGAEKAKRVAPCCASLFSLH